MGEIMKNVFLLMLIVIFLSSCTFENPVQIKDQEQVESHIEDGDKDEDKDEQEISCPKNFIFVPGDDDLATNDFCVAKYEMKKAFKSDSSIDVHGNLILDCSKTKKNELGMSWNLWDFYGMKLCYEFYRPAEMLAVSVPEGKPWVGIGRGGESARSLGAVNACRELSNIDFEYDLISMIEWQSIAKNIENNPVNWSGGQVGLGFINTGHSDRNSWHSDDHENNGPLEASGDDDPYAGIDSVNEYDPNDLNNHKYKRTHTLSNGEIIWDFSGNALELVDASVEEILIEIGFPTADKDTRDQKMQEFYGPSNAYDPTIEEELGKYHIVKNNGVILRGGAYSKHPGIYSVVNMFPKSDCWDHKDWCLGAGLGDTTFRCVAVSKKKKLKSLVETAVDTSSLNRAY